jgi:hypothetical protein
MMYPSPVKRLQISIDVELDDALAVEADRRGVSKAALIREYVRERLVDGRARVRDPLDDLLGASDAEPGDIDEVVYGA